jgi:hypothetical protein
MNNPHYESVRKAVISACPELLDLSHGCRIIMRDRDNDNEYSIINTKTFGNVYTNDLISYKWQVRLNSIFLALEKTGKPIDIQNNVHESIVIQWHDEEVVWDLTKDNLAQQDPSVWEALDKMLT